MTDCEADSEGCLLSFSWRLIKPHLRYRVIEWNVWSLTPVSACKGGLGLFTSYTFCLLVHLNLSRCFLHCEHWQSAVPIRNKRNNIIQGCPSSSVGRACKPCTEAVSAGSVWIQPVTLSSISFPLHVPCAMFTCPFNDKLHWPVKFSHQM